MNALLPKIKEVGLAGIKSVLPTLTAMFWAFIIGTVVIFAIAFFLRDSPALYRAITGVWLLVVFCFGIKAAYKSLKPLGKWAWFGGLVGFMVPVIVGLPLVMLRGRTRDQGERELLAALWSGQMEFILMAIIFSAVIGTPSLIGGVIASVSTWWSET